MSYNIAVIDTETTNIDPVKAKVVEIAVVSGRSVFVNLVNPGEPIPVETSAIHHIIDEDVKNSPCWDEVKTSVGEYLETMGIQYPAAHNAKYDKTVTQLNFLPWICTYKCALRQWPDAPTHKNEGLKYWLQLGKRGRFVSHDTHSALHDALVTELILTELLKHQSVETLLQWSNEPRYLPKIPFGKFRGSPWSDADKSYLNWIIKQDMDEDIIAAAKAELQRRKDET